VAAKLEHLVALNQVNFPPQYLSWVKILHQISYHCLFPMVLRLSFVAIFFSTQCFIHKRCPSRNKNAFPTCIFPKEIVDCKRSLRFLPINTPCIMFRQAACSLVLLTIVCTADMLSQHRPLGKSFATRSEVIAPHGMACTSQPLATQAALDILKQGGTAIDAAIAANAVLGLVEPTGNGMGGDLFAIVWDAKTKKLHGLNASGRSPYSLSMEHFKKLGLKSIPPLGPLPVSVPGCVDGWFELHKKFGKLPMTTVLAPAIAYAREGFPLSEVIAYYWGRTVPALSPFPNFKETFTINGRAPQKGERFANPNLAKTLETVAKGGRDAFYKGAIAKTVADYMKRNGGFLTEKDFADHTSDWIEPVSTNYRGYDVWELPPNGQGIAALQMLNILEKYDMKSFGFGSKEHIHYFVLRRSRICQNARQSAYFQRICRRAPKAHQCRTRQPHT
jgi:gamma-glutamyltranspeptidase